MEVEFDRGPRGPHSPRVGDVWVIPAEHRYAALAHGRTVQFCELRVPTAVLAERDLMPRTGHRDPFVHHLVERVSTTANRSDVTARLLTESLAESMRLHLVDQFAGGATRGRRGRSLDKPTRARLMEYLEYGLDSDISLAALAELTEMPVAEFSAAFTTAFGATPHQFVLNRRIHRAKTLLATTAMSITEIAVTVGFSTPSHFATTFKNRVGMSPSAYRRHV